MNNSINNTNFVEISNTYEKMKNPLSKRLTRYDGLAYTKPNIQFIQSDNNARQSYRTRRYSLPPLLQTLRWIVCANASV